jgi:argininosuccinate lyase
VVAHAVKLGLQRGIDLSELPLDELKALHPALGDDAPSVLTLQSSLQARRVRGDARPQS